MNKANALQILLSERKEVASSVTEDLVRDVFGIEERVQFDEERKEAPQKINNIVQATLDKDFLEDSGDENAPR